MRKQERTRKIARSYRGPSPAFLRAMDGASSDKSPLVVLRALHGGKPVAGALLVWHEMDPGNGFSRTHMRKSRSRAKSQSSVPLFDWHDRSLMFAAEATAPSGSPSVETTI
jgi:hypothetical protein